MFTPPDPKSPLFDMVRGIVNAQAALVRASDGLPAEPARRRRLCRDCADYDGTCPNDGLPCKRESADLTITRIEFAAGHEDARVTSEQVAALMRKVRLAPRMLQALRDGRRKLATYTAVYSGDKELRRLLGEWDALIGEAEGRLPREAA
jgi:hypothetical protein